MTRHTILSNAAAFKLHYMRASRHEKRAILRAFCQLAGSIAKRRFACCAAHPPQSAQDVVDGHASMSLTVVPILVETSEASDLLSSKRLAPVLLELVAALERQGELFLSADARRQAPQLCPATIYHMLNPVSSSPGRLPLTQSSELAARPASPCPSVDYAPPNALT